MTTSENFDLVIFPKTIPAAMHNAVDCLRPIAKLIGAFHSVIQLIDSENSLLHVPETPNAGSVNNVPMTDGA
jgi:hypothetical protein